MAGTEAPSSSKVRRPFRKNIAAEGDTVIVTYCKNEIQLIKLRRGATTQNKCGAIKHNDVIGKPYGSRIATSVGRVNILALDPAIWAISVPHRTQIIYPIDASMIVGQLDLVPGCRVLEAGTGSGALTHALAQAVWPTGHVSTFDFHQERVERANVEFEEHGLKDVVSVEHRDVLSDGFPEAGSQHNPDGCHAIMIDLPEPWVVVPTIAKCFTSSGQENATDLFNGTYTYKTAQVGETAETDSEARKGAPRRSERHLFPPLSNYLTPNTSVKGNGQGGRQYGYWAALPKQKDTGHTGYLTFASSIPIRTSMDVDSQSDAME